MAESSDSRFARQCRGLGAALAVAYGGLLLMIPGMAVVRWSGLAAVPEVAYGILCLGVGGGALGGLALRERLLRGKGEPPPVLRSPRGLRGVCAFAAGYLVGVGPTLVVSFMRTHPLGQAIAPAVRLYTMFGPLLGLIVTRALCRRWGTPSPPAVPAAAPRPAPVVEPAPDRPGPTLLPATA